MFFIILAVFITGVIAGLLNLFMVIGATNILILILFMIVGVMILDKLCLEEEAIEDILEKEIRGNNEKGV